jgi:hypothetical protein
VSLWCWTPRLTDHVQRYPEIALFPAEIRPIWSSFLIAVLVGSIDILEKSRIGFDSLHHGWMLADVLSDWPMPRSEIFASNLRWVLFQFRKRDWMAHDKRLELNMERWTLRCLSEREKRL